MNTRQLTGITLSVTAAAFALTLSSGAQAGQCTGEINQLQNLLSKSGSGGASTAAIQKSQTKPDQVDVANAAQTNATEAKIVPPTGNAMNTGPVSPNIGEASMTSGANDMLENRPTAPNDIQQQESNQHLAASGSGKPAALNIRVAEASLTRARKLDEGGKEAACQDEIAKAKTAFGAQ